MKTRLGCLEFAEADRFRIEHMHWKWEDELMRELESEHGHLLQCDRDIFSVLGEADALLSCWKEAVHSQFDARRNEFQTFDNVLGVAAASHREVRHALAIVLEVLRHTSDDDSPVSSRFDLARFRASPWYVQRMQSIESTSTEDLLDFAHKLREYSLSGDRLLAREGYIELKDHQRLDLLPSENEACRKDEKAIQAMQCALEVALANVTMLLGYSDPVLERVSQAVTWEFKKTTTFQDPQSLLKAATDAHKAVYASVKSLHAKLKAPC
ncbi:MAG: hypothetical protein H7210_03065, partial [Pyrinomonadaceae bacterium]|nr:hypothetical protein [Phycisphaerales bacterium]